MRAGNIADRAGDDRRPPSSDLAAEIFDDDADTARVIDEIVTVVGIEKVMFELPGPWISNVHHHDIHRLRRELIERYGTQVNIGNCSPDDLLSLEAFRRGLGVNAGSP